MSDRTLTKIPVIRDQTLEHIGQYLGGVGSWGQITRWLQSWGVPHEIMTGGAGAKWRMVYSILKHYAYSQQKEDHEMLFKVICEMLHPLMFGGDKTLAQIVATDFNTYLEYDDWIALYNEQDRKYEIYDKRKVIDAPEDDEDLALFAEDLFIQEQEEIATLRRPENKEKISTLRKAYQMLMNITEVFCENPSKPTHELNDAYIKTKKLVMDAVSEMHLYVSSVNGKHRMHRLNNYCIPFNNLFGAEKEYDPDDLDLSGKQLTWDYLRPKMNATYGEIDELYRKVEGSEILSKPDVQQTLNDTSLLLSQTREENEKLKKAKQKAEFKPTPIPKAPVHRIEITNPELIVRNADDSVISKGKKRLHLPHFPTTDWAKISIKFIDEQNVFIEADKKQSTANYQTLGFEDGKKGKPDTAWAMLFALAKNNGETQVLQSPIPEKIRQQKSKLANRLKAIFKNEADPFYDVKENNIYRIKITLLPPQSEEVKHAYDPSELLGDIS